MPNEQLDAIALLKDDHRKVEALFEKVENAKDGKTKKATRSFTGHKVEQGEALESVA